MRLVSTSFRGIHEPVNGHKVKRSRHDGLLVRCGGYFFPVRASSQERLKVIYSQFTMTNSATWFAREAGLFERHGLMADLVYVDSTPAVQALTAGAAPVATMSGGLAVGPYLNGLDLVMLAGWCNLNSYQLVTRPEIRRVEDLRGKVIGIGRFGAAADWGLRLILRKLGINENKDVQIIQAGAARATRAQKPPTRRDSSICVSCVRSSRAARSTSCMDVEHHRKPACLVSK